MSQQRQMATRFKALHAEPGGFVMPNAWDAGSAVILAQAGFHAIATTSAGIAFSLGRPDYDVRDAALAVSREAMFDRMRAIVEIAGCPVNGDLEAGFGDRPEDVAETVRRAIAIGLAGGNIEDKRPGVRALYDEALAVARIAAARAAIDASGTDFVLTARTDVFQLMREGAVEACIRRANLYRAAGADLLYPPGVADLPTIRRLVRDIEGPLNIVIGLGDAALSAGALIEAGVKRVSLGGSIARAALGFVARGMAELQAHGTIGFAAGQLPQSRLNAMFAAARGAQ